MFRFWKRQGKKSDKSAFYQNLHGVMKEFLGSGDLTWVTGFNRHIKKHVTFQLSFYFLEMKSHNGSIEPTSECFGAHCGSCWR